MRYRSRRAATDSLLQQAVKQCAIVKAECNGIGTNRSFVVTNRPGPAVLPDAIYDEYAERGESENRNKGLKCGLSGDRLSCERFMANYFRLMLHAAALNLLVRLRAVVSDPPTLPAWTSEASRKTWLVADLLMMTGEATGGRLLRQVPLADCG